MLGSCILIWLLGEYLLGLFAISNQCTWPVPLSIILLLFNIYQYSIFILSYFFNYVL